MAPSSHERELMSECTSLIHRLNSDELEVMAGILRGLVHGHRKYGPLDIGTDKRDMVAEGMEELRDAAVYLSIRALKIKRGMQ